MPLVKYYGDGRIIEVCPFLKSIGDGGAVLADSPVDERRKALAAEYPWLAGTQTEPIAGFYLDDCSVNGSLIFDPWMRARWELLGYNLFPREFDRLFPDNQDKSFIFNGLVYGGEFHYITPIRTQLTIGEKSPVGMWDLIHSIVKRVVRYIGIDNSLLSFKVSLHKSFIEGKESYKGCWVHDVGFGLLDFEGDGKTNAERVENLVAQLEGID